MTAVTHNITVEQGATMRLLFKWESKDAQNVVTPVNLTTYSARLQIRKNVSATDTLLSLTSPTGITLDASGNIVVEATPAQTSAIDSRVGVYDLELEAADGRVTRLVEGKVTIKPEVTR